jgi:DNA-binding NarL/FixJ family response regulator
MLLGRDPELRAIDRALADVRLGRSAALQIRGEIGIGKTARLRHAVSGAAAMRVLSARTVALALPEGRTTREAATKLYLSPKTVEYHLRDVYDQLEIRSREELAAFLGARPA